MGSGQEISPILADVFPLQVQLHCFRADNQQLLRGCALHHHKVTETLL